MATWVIGDIHGCAQELGQLLLKLHLGPADRVLCVGDLFHRGPDPVGVMEHLQANGASFLLGNHEHLVLQRFHLAPSAIDSSDRPPLRTEFPALEDADLRGDGNIPCSTRPERRADVLRFLQTHCGFFVEHPMIPNAGTTPDGRPWCAVHAGLIPGVAPADSRPEDLLRVRRLRRRGRPFWYEVYTGPNLVLFGHTPGRIPRTQHHDGKLVALGLDTGCVYGGLLTAYSPERDEFVQVKAAKAYASV